MTEDLVPGNGDEDIDISLVLGEEEASKAEAQVSEASAGQAKVLEVNRA
jgi:hypothetical protein